MKEYSEGFEKVDKGLFDGEPDDLIDGGVGLLDFKEAIEFLKGAGEGFQEASQGLDVAAEEGGMKDEDEACWWDDHLPENS